MRKIALIVDTSLKDYAVNTLSRLDGKISCIIEWVDTFSAANMRTNLALVIIKNFCQYLLKHAKLKLSRFDTILIVGESRKSALDMIYKAMLSWPKVKDIFCVKPFLANNNIDFINDGDFNPEFVKRVPEFPKFNADEILNPVVPSCSSSRKIFTTQDGIKACEIENVFVKISEDNLLGCTYTDNYNILDGCINGPRNFAHETCINLMSSVKPDFIYDDEYVCPLTRLYSSWSVYHFMYEVLDKIIIAEELGFDGKYMLFRNDYAVSLLTLLGIDETRLIWINKEDAGKLFLLRKAFDVEGFMLSSRKGLSRLNKFADECGEKFGACENYPDKIFITETGKNDEPDFTAISPEKYSPEEIMKLFFHAEVVKSSDNPVLANILFMRKGKSIIEKFPYNWGSLLLNNVISSRGLQYVKA